MRPQTPFIERMDTLVFLGLSVFMMGSVCLGYRIFVIPANHVRHISCEESCERIATESVRQSQSLLKFGNGLMRGGLNEILTASQTPGYEAAGYPTSIIPLSIPIDLARTTLYNPLYLLSIFFDLPFHVVFSLLCVFLITASAALLERMTINDHRQLWGKGYYLAVQLIPFLFTHGRLVVLTFSIVLLLYLFYLPAHEKNTRSTILLYPVCLLCASLSTGVFFVVYAGYLVQLVCQRNLLTRRNMIILIVLASFFLPASAWTVLKNFHAFDNQIDRLIVEHGVASRGFTDQRDILRFAYVIALSCLALLPLLFPWSKTFFLHGYFHTITFGLILCGILFATNFSRLLLLTNALLFKVTLLDTHRLTTWQHAQAPHHANAPDSSPPTDAGA